MSDDIIRVQFTPNGKVYHYLLGGCLLGDKVTGPGCTGPATVIGFGSKGYSGPLKPAKHYYGADAAVHAIADDGLKSWPSWNIYNYTSQEAYLTMKHTHPTTTDIEQLTEQLKAAKKADKRARKLAREKAKLVAERARLHGVAFSALEHVAAHGFDEGARIAAATVLLDRA